MKGHARSARRLIAHRLILQPESLIRLRNPPARHASAVRAFGTIGACHRAVVLVIFVLDTVRRPLAANESQLLRRHPFPALGHALFEHHEIAAGLRVDGLTRQPSGFTKRRIGNAIHASLLCDDRRVMVLPPMHHRRNHQISDFGLRIADLTIRPLHGHQIQSVTFGQFGERLERETIGRRWHHQNIFDFWFLISDSRSAQCQRDML